MLPSSMFKLVGGITAILTGGLLVAAHILNLLSDAEQGTVFSPLFAFLGHMTVIFAFVGMYEAQGQKNGYFSLAGILLSVTGTVSLCAVLYLDIVALYGVDVEPLMHGLIPRLILILSPLIYGLGIIFFAISLIKVGLFPSWSAWALIIGTLTFGAGSELGIAKDLTAVLGAAVMCIGFVRLGLRLLGMAHSQHQREKIRVGVKGAIHT